jgi:phosphoenolpyruvate carboxykinase (ATP)
MLRERLEQHSSSVWLVNTGWSGGGYGVGRRMPLAHTRALLRAVLAGQLAEVSYEADPVFGVGVPASCPGVPSEILRPRRTWADPEAYDAQAKRLAGLFHSNFERFVSQAPAAVRKAGPRQE